MRKQPLQPEHLTEHLTKDSFLQNIIEEVLGELISQLPSMPGTARNPACHPTPSGVPLTIGDNTKSFCHLGGKHESLDVIFKG